MKKLTINIPGDRGKLYEVIHFPAGEIHVRLTGNALEACASVNEYVIVANPIPDIIELAQLKDALDSAMDVRWKQLDLPYLPYARADRRFVPGDCYGLEVFAGLLNSLKFDSIHTFDAHSKRAVEDIESLVNISPIEHDDQITPAIKFLKPRGKYDLVLIAPDKGAASRYDLASFGFPVLVAGKIRNAKDGKLSGFTIPNKIVKYKKALIIDDICDGGGTFIGLGEVIKEANPRIELNLYVSHGIFSQGTEKFHPLFKNLFVSDYSFKSEKIKGWKNL